MAWSPRIGRRHRGGSILLLSDTFTRANNTTSLGNAEIGGAWTAHGGTWGVISNTAYCSASAAYHAASIDTGQANVTVQLTQTVANDASSFGGIAARVTDDSNFIYVENNTGGCQLFKQVAGVFTQIGSTFPGAGQNGDVLRLVCSGNSLSVYRNGVLAVAVSESFNASATRHGMAGTGTVFRLDNLSVTIP